MAACYDANEVRWEPATGISIDAAGAVFVHELLGDEGYTICRTVMPASQCQCGYVRFTSESDAA